MTTIVKMRHTYDYQQGNQKSKKLALIAAKVYGKLFKFSSTKKLLFLIVSFPCDNHYPVYNKKYFWVGSVKEYKQKSSLSPKETTILPSQNHHSAKWAQTELPRTPFILTALNLSICTTVLYNSQQPLI